MIVPYQIALHDGRLIFAPQDTDHVSHPPPLHWLTVHSTKGACVLQVIRLRPPAAPDAPSSPEYAAQAYEEEDDGEDYPDFEEADREEEEEEPKQQQG
jgi:hypothetical protein